MVCTEQYTLGGGTATSVPGVSRSFEFELLLAKQFQPVVDFKFRKKHGLVVFPKRQCRDEEFIGATSRRFEFVNNPQYTVNAQTSFASNSPQEAVASEQEGIVPAPCCDKTKAIIGRQLGMFDLDAISLSDQIGRKVESLHAAIFEKLPFLAGEIK